MRTTPDELSRTPEHECVGAIIVRGESILLGKRSAERNFYPDVWDVFGGHVETGESYEQTLRRELGEELGIVPIVWQYLETFFSLRLCASASNYLQRSSTLARHTAINEKDGRPTTDDG